ncbi:MAG: Maf family nucleotide pyrophosphatase [Xanthomonadales bacterium]|nr:Maf family nucleotide pyrophosphatase [Xanthomonadales bacterium]
MPEVIAVDVDESQFAAEAWQDYVVRIALKKARAGVLMSTAGVPVLGADTSVIVDDKVLGKPESCAAAEKMLTLLSARSHQVATAVVLVLPEGDCLQAMSVSQVSFADMPPDFIRSYCASGDAMDKAGAYAVQGQPAAFIERLEGSYSGVMGLPLYETASLLRQAGVAW